MRRRPVVLLVDDTVDVLDMYEMALDDRYTIVRATRGTEACEIARTEKPDVIVLDVLMPDLDGFSTALRLRADTRTGQIPIIFLTASEAQDMPARAVKAGAVMLLTKPCSVEKLSATIDATLDVCSAEP